MTTYNTGNALGSSDARDLYDNAENIDKFANGSANTFNDRLGVSRKSIAGMENAFDAFIQSSGYTVPVAYTSGIVLSAYNQLIEYNDEFYKLKAGEAPYTTTGTWGTDSAKLVAVGDAALRQELTANANDFNLLPELASYAALDAYTGDLTAVYVRGVSSIFDGGHGIFRRTTDTPAAANGVYRQDALGRWWKREFSGCAYLRWFGASTDPLADNTVAIQAALDAGVSVIDGEGKEYRAAGKVYFRSNTKLRNTAFDLRNFECGITGREYALNAVGTIGSDILLTENASADQGPLPVISIGESDAATLSAGDICLLTQNVYWNGDNNCYIGEIIEVRSVSGGTIYTQQPLLYSYTTANGAKIRKITAVENVSLENVSAVGPANPAGIISAVTTNTGGYYQGSYVYGRYAGFFGAFWARNVDVNSCQARLFNRAGFEFRSTYRSWLRNSIVRDIPNYYGCLVADAATYTWIDKNSFTNTRHGVSTGASNTFSGGGIVNHLWVTYNESTGRDAALDCHDETDNVHFLYNKLRCEGIEDNGDGIMYQGKNCEIIGNEVTGFVNIGIRVQPTYNYPGLLPRVIIRNNRVDTTNVRTVGTTAQGVNVQYGILSGNTGIMTQIDGNQVIGPVQRGISLSVEAAGTSAIEDFSITNNQVNGAVSSGIYVQAAGQNISRGIITGNAVKMGGDGDAIVLRADTGKTISGVFVQRNPLTNAANGVRLLGVGSFSQIDARDNLYSSVMHPLSASFSSLTIASGVIALIGQGVTSIKVATEGGTSTDDLTDITGGVDGQIITLRPVNSTNDVVVKDGTTLRLAGDCTLDNVDDSITLLKSGTQWIEIARSNNGV